MNGMDNMLLTKREYDNLTVLMEHMKDITDKDVENLNRTFKVMRDSRYHYQEDAWLVNSWCNQWNNNEEYNIYKADEVEIFCKDNMLFLIPHADRKPIKLIIA